MTAIVTINTDNRREAIQTVLDSVTSLHTRRAYERTLTDFLTWHSEQGQPPLTKAVVNSYKSHLEQTGKGAATINQTLSAIRKLVREAADNGAIDPIHAAGIANVKGIKYSSLPDSRLVTPGELAALLNTCDQSATGMRDAAIIAVLYSCGLRRAELVGLDLADYDSQAGTLRIFGKGRKERLTPVVNGTRAALEDWLSIRGDKPGPLFCQIRKGGHIWFNRLTTQAVYHVLSERAQQAGVTAVSPHDFRHSFISDLLDAGADIVTVQKMAGHADVSTTARYDRRGEETKRKAAELLHVPYRRRALG